MSRIIQCVIRKTKCFPPVFRTTLNVLIFVLHSIYFPLDVERLFQTKHQITLTNRPLSSLPRPMGLQLGAVVSLNIYVGTVNGSSVARERCSPLQKQEEHIDLWCTLETKKHASQGPEAWGSKLRRLIRGDISRCPALIYTWSRLTGLCKGNLSISGAYVWK